MGVELTEARLLKFELLASGVAIAPSAQSALHELNGQGSLSPHDYASTSGLILNLDDDVWVNAPIQLYNPNFVGETPYRLEFDDRFVVEGGGLASAASFWPQPAYHGTTVETPNGARPLNNYVVTHADRARLSPIVSCSMTCTFCNIPFDDPLDTYALKGVDVLLAAAQAAIDDPRQPAQHLLISGGTPKPKDIGWMQEFYAAVLQSFPKHEVDLMMVPLPGLFDLDRLAALGLHELSINIELYGREHARPYMRQKYNQGLDFYLDFIEEAGTKLGPGRARSMLMVGLEPMDATLAGVRAIAERGGTPVLSPFRPDPATPLRSHTPPTAEFLRETYLRAEEIVAELGSRLGPDCPPCTHNTMGFATDEHGSIAHRHALPRMLGGST